MSYLGPEDRSQMNEQRQDDMLLEDSIERAKELPRVMPCTQWAMPKDGPWGGHFPPVTIRDVREGWVRYEAPYFPDQRMEESAFVRLYKPLETFERGQA